MALVGAVVSLGAAMSMVTALLLGHPPGSAPTGPGLMQTPPGQELPNQEKTLGDPPPIVVRSADANNLIKLATISPKLTYDVQIEEIADQQVADLQVAVWALAGSATGPLDIGMCPAKKDEPKPDQAQFKPLHPRQLVKVCLDAELPSVGTYGATLSLHYYVGTQPRRDNYTIAIERRAPPTTFAVTALPVGPVESPFFLFSPSDLTGDPGATEAAEWSVPVRVTISEIAGQGVRISPPRVVQFSQFGANDTIVQSDPGRVTVRNEAGAELKPGDRLVLTPKSSQVIDLIPKKLLEPGQYRAKVEASTDEGAMVQTDVDIRVRHGWIPAFVLIVIGALVSYGLRQWVAAGRDRVLQDRQFERRIAALRPHRADPLVAALLDRLEEAREDFSLGGSTPAKELLTDTDDLLPLVRDLRGRITTAALPVTLVKLVDDARTRAYSSLASYSKDGVSRSQAAVEAVARALEVAIMALPFQRRIDELRRQLEHAVEPARWAPVADELDEAQQALNEALARAMTAQGAGDAILHQLATDLDAADAQYASAVQQYLQLCEEGLVRTLDAWTAIFDELKADEASGLTARQLVRSRATLDRAVAGAGGFPGTGGLDASLDRYDSIVGEIQQLEKQLPSTVLVIFVQDARLHPPRILRRLKGPSTAAPALVTRILRFLIRFRPVRSQTTERRRGIFTPKRKVILLDLGVTAVVAIFSALIGIQLLWIPNLTFGGLNDYITALVWGFGLHQLNEVARQGGPMTIGNALRSGPS